MRDFLLYNDILSVLKGLYQAGGTLFHKMISTRTRAAARRHTSFYRMNANYTLKRNSTTSPSCIT